MFNLLIVESPAKCSKIEHILSVHYPKEKFKVIATKGHIMDTGKELNIDIENNFKPKYSWSLKNNKQIEEIKKAYEKAKDIYIATDLDYAGSFIAYSVCLLLNLDITKTKRLIFNSITENAIIKAYENPTIINMNHVYYELTRSIIDKIIGYKLTPIACKYTKNRYNSVGRCQTVALRLIVQREKEIKDFYNNLNKNICDNYSINTTFRLKQNIKENGKGYNNILNAHNDCIKSAYIKSFNDPNIKFIIEKKEITEKTIKPPAPFITATIQQAGAKLGYSASSVMLSLQRLYENGLITYIRTDCPIISPDFKKTIQIFINDKYGKEYLNLNTKENIKEHSQNGHEAIRITDLNIKDIEDFDYNKTAKNVEKLRDNRIYKLIYKNTIQSQMSDNRYYLTTLTIGNNFNDIKLYSELKSLIFNGFKLLDDNSLSFYCLNDIKKIKLNEILDNYDTIYFKAKYTNPPKRFNESKVIKTLDSLGIGRPSTYSTFIEKLKDKNYITFENIINGQMFKYSNFKIIKGETDIKEEIKEEILFNEYKKFIPTNKGLTLIEGLISNFDYIIDYDYTALMEKDLDKIANSEVQYIDILNAMWNNLKNHIESYNNKSKKITSGGKADNKVENIKPLDNFNYNIEVIKTVKVKDKEKLRNQKTRTINGYVLKKKPDNTPYINYYFNPKDKSDKLVIYFKKRFENITVEDIDKEIKKQESIREKKIKQMEKLKTQKTRTIGEYKLIRGLNIPYINYHYDKRNKNRYKQLTINKEFENITLKDIEKTIKDYEKDLLVKRDKNYIFMFNYKDNEAKLSKGKYGYFINFNGKNFKLKGKNFLDIINKFTIDKENQDIQEELKNFCVNKIETYYGSYEINDNVYDIYKSEKDKENKTYYVNIFNNINNNKNYKESLMFKLKDNEEINEEFIKNFILNLNN